MCSLHLSQQANVSQEGEAECLGSQNMEQRILKTRLTSQKRQERDTCQVSRWKEDRKTKESSSGHYRSKWDEERLGHCAQPTSSIWPEAPFIHCMQLLGKAKFSFIKAPFRLGIATGTKTKQKSWVLGSSNLRLTPVAMNIVTFIELHNCSKPPHPQNGCNGNTYYERAVLRIK